MHNDSQKDRRLENTKVSVRDTGNTMKGVSIRVLEMTEQRKEKNDSKVIEKYWLIL